MKKSILIIEDNTDMLENISELLELTGYQTLKANNGKEGLVLAHKYNPDLVLCDIMMPELDGYGVLRAMENIPDLLGTPFIFLTAKADKTDFRRGMDLGADDYLVKPFDGDELLRVVIARLKKNELIKKSLENETDTLSDSYSVPKTDQQLLSDQRTIKKLRKKDMLFMEGDSADFLYFLISGKIKIFKSNELGKEYIIDIHKEGDFIGYVPLLEGNKHKGAAMAIEKSEVAMIPKQDFIQIINSNKDVSMQFMKLVSSNFSDSEEKLLKLAYDSARKRVAEAILFISKKYQTEGKDDLSFTMLRENISALSGISPESVSRNLSAFKEEGLIETYNGIIKILNLKKLEMLKN